MNLDIRKPLGWLFVLIGVLLLVAASRPPIVDAEPASRLEHVWGLNIDLVWGLVMALFGVIMVLLSRRPPPAGGDVNGR